jgi:periplasmic protein CpxP/Spy
MKKALVILASTLAMSGAFAQTAAPAAASAATAPAGKHERGVENRIAHLHSQLKITPAQETQWSAFADVMRSNADTMDQLFQQRQQAGSMSAVDDMKSYATIAQAHADGVKKLIDAFEPLYNSFSPDQKKLADQTFHQGPGAGGKKRG